MTPTPSPVPSLTHPQPADIETSPQVRRAWQAPSATALDIVHDTEGATGSNIDGLGGDIPK